jgi:hypothetical protein
MAIQIIDIGTTVLEVVAIMLYASGHLLHKTSLKRLSLGVIMAFIATKICSTFLPPDLSTFVLFFVDTGIAIVVVRVKYEQAVLNVITTFSIILGSNALAFQVLLFVFGYKNLLHMQRDAFSFFILASPEIVTLSIFLALNRRIYLHCMRIFNDKKAKLLQYIGVQFLLFVIIAMYQLNTSISNVQRLLPILFFFIISMLTVTHVMKNYIHVDVKNNLLRQNQHLMQHIRERNNKEGHLLPIIHANITIGKLEEAKEQIEQWMKQNKEFGYEKIFEENNGLLILGFGDCFFNGIDVVFEENADLNDSSIDTLDLHFIFTKIVEKFIVYDLDYVKVTTYDNLTQILIEIEIYSKGPFPKINTDTLKNIVIEYGGKFKVKIKGNKAILEIKSEKRDENEKELSFEEEMALMEERDAKNN